MSKISTNANPHGGQGEKGQEAPPKQETKPKRKKKASLPPK